jgi:Flp pilus assembly protein CpaB
MHVSHLLRRRGRRNSSISDALRAQRIRTSRWGDLRLWIGVVLLVASMFIGARMLSQGSETVTVWQAARDLSVGSAAVHIQPVTVALGGMTDDYLPATEQPAGRLRYPIPAGELIPRSALIPEGEAPSRVVTVGVHPLHAPVDLAPGDRVDVWSTPSDSSTTRSMRPGDVLGPVLVLESIAVEKVSADSLGSQLAVVLRVAPDQVAALVEAVRGGAVDLVSIPIFSQISETTS